MIIAPTKVNWGLVHSIKLDLSVLLIGSTSSDNGYSLRRGFQVTYLFGEKSEKRVLFPLFLKLAHALSQSVEVSPLSLPLLSGEPREQRGTSARGGSRRAKNLPEPSSISMDVAAKDSISRAGISIRDFLFPSSYPGCRGEAWRRGSETTTGAKVALA